MMMNMMMKGGVTFLPVSLVAHPRLLYSLAEFCSSSKFLLKMTQSLIHKSNFWTRLYTTVISLLIQVSPQNDFFSWKQNVS